MKIKFVVAQLLLFLFFADFAKAQKDVGQLRGNFEVNARIYQPDSAIGADTVPGIFRMNSYANLIYTRGNFTAGLRYEAYQKPLLGYDKRYEGQGIAHRYFSWDNEVLGITVGNFYEQFGNGLILRSYEDKALGVDNSFDGVRFRLRALNGANITALVGKQRYFWDKGPGIIRGVNGDFYLNELLPFLSESKTIYQMGLGFVSKYQEDNDPVYKLPENVSAFSGRMAVQRGFVNVSGEYAYKINDPSADNGYIYKNGDALLINASYSQSGLGIFAGFKRIDNMSYRSDRNAGLNNLNINFLPAISKVHTYSLAAMYPYATQPNGEVGFQGEINYSIKRETLLGGKYGTKLSFNYSQVYSLKTSPVFDGTGYESDFFGLGDELYFRDANFKLYKKFSRDFKTTVSYFNIAYNKDVVEGVAGYGLVNANVAVLDMTYKTSMRKSLRWEIQGLFTEDDRGDWASVLLEYNIAPKWFFAVSDEYNYGNPREEKQVHYYSINAGYKKGASRIELGYGRQRDGILCVGGVCRRVPSSSGFYITISSSF